MRSVAPAVVVGSLLAAGCAATGAVPRPFPRPGPPPAAAASPALPSVDPASLAGTALSLRGAPYRDGGADPSGFDCSGFVAYVFARHGHAVPRTVTAQYGLGGPVSQDRIQPGDLVFFTTLAPGASHVGIAVSATEFVHAPSSGGVVRVESFLAPYWESRYVGARRLP